MTVLFELKNPPENIVRIAKIVFETMTMEQLLREKLEPVKLHCMKLVKAVRKRTGEPLTKVQQLYNMSTGQFREWEEEYIHALKKLGYTDKRYQEEHICPLLEAESLTRDAKHALVLALEEITGILWEDLSWHPVKYAKYINLSLRWLAQFVKV